MGHLTLLFQWSKMFSSSDSERESHKSNHTEQFLITFFNITYFLGLSPFRLKRRPGSKEIFAATWWPHTLFCILLLLLGLFWNLRDLRISLPSKPQNPSLYLLCFQKWITTGEKIALMMVFWCHQNNVADIVNYVACSDNSLPLFPHSVSRRFYIKAKAVTTLLYITYGSCALIEILRMKYTGISLLQEGLIGSGTFQYWLFQWWKTVIASGRFNFFIPNNGENTTFSEGFEFSDNAIGVLTIAGLYYRRLMGVYNDIFLLSASFTLWFSAKAFSYYLVLSRNKPVEWTNIKDKYDALYNLSELINKVAGNTVFCFLIGRTIFHAIGFETGTNDWVRLVIMLNYLVGSSAVLILGADACHQVNKLNHWFNTDDNVESVPTDQLIALQSDLDTRKISIKGNNVYPVTYSGLAKITCQTVTYFIICITTPN